MENVCKLCEGVINFHEGFKGNNYDKTKLMFIAHLPDARISELVFS